MREPSAITVEATVWMSTMSIGAPVQCTAAWLRSVIAIEHDAHSTDAIPAAPASLRRSSARELVSFVAANASVDASSSATGVVTGRIAPRKPVDKIRLRDLECSRAKHGVHTLFCAPLAVRSRLS